MPALVPVVDSLETVAEPLRQFYEAKDGKYVVTLSATPPGFVPASELAAANGKVVEFRDNNIALQKSLDALKPLEAFKDLGVDAAAAKAALDAQKALGATGVTKPDDIQNLVAQAVANAIKPLQEKLTTQETSLASERKRADEALLRSTVAEKFLKAGGEAKAVDYILSHASKVFVVENGTVKPVPTAFSADRPGEPLSMEEWLTGAAVEHAFAFKGNEGPGASPSRTTTVTRPGVQVIKDPTPEQLGRYGADVKAGKVRFEFTNG